jgi:uroporphyrinogen-III synthase
VEVEEVVAYRTLEAPGASRTLLRAAIDAGPIAAIVLTSGSTARGLAALAAEESIALGSIPAVCIGAPTADAAIAAGLRVVAVSADPTVASLAGTVAAALATRTGTRLTPQLQEAS